MKILNNIDLGKKTTIGIGGQASYYCEAKRESDLIIARNFAKKNNLGIIFFGLGSNILFSKDIKNKLVCRIKNNFFEKIGYSSENGTHFNFEEEYFNKNKKIFEVQEEIFELKNKFLNFNKNILQNSKNKSEDNSEKTILNDFGIFKVGAGTVLGNLINILIKDNFDLTNLAGFPSTIGGAIVGNAGLCGSEIKDFLISAKVLNLETGKYEEWQNEDFEFEYRSSKIKKFINQKSEKQVKQEDQHNIRNISKNNFVISSCILKIPKTRLNLEDGLKLKLTRNLNERAQKQPKGRSAGSFFKNPYPHFAGKLIECVGLKGFKIGGAYFSGKHANFLMTKEGVTVKDILKLRNLAKRKVRDNFGIELEEEIVIY